MHASLSILNCNVGLVNFWLHDATLLYTPLPPLRYTDTARQTDRPTNRETEPEVGSQSVSSETSPAPQPTI